VALGGQGRLHHGAEVLFAPVAILIGLGLSEAWFARRQSV
jgi:hypothetical protein